jgi:hypothetical protein
MKPFGEQTEWLSPAALDHHRPCFRTVETLSKTLMKSTK